MLSFNGSVYNANDGVPLGFIPFGGVWHEDETTCSALLCILWFQFSRLKMFLFLFYFVLTLFYVQYTPNIKYITHILCSILFYLVYQILPFVVLTV